MSLFVQCLQQLECQENLTLKRPALFWRDCKGSIWQSFPFTCENGHALHYNRLNIPEAAVGALIVFLVELAKSEGWRGWSVFRFYC